MLIPTPMPVVIGLSGISGMQKLLGWFCGGEGAE
jgi:hypothetical protein